MLEKLLLVMALLGFAHMAFLGLGKSIKLAFVLTDRLIAARRPKTVPISPCLRDISLFKSREEDQWSIYETPTFLRRGLSLPTQLADKTDDRVVSQGVAEEVMPPPDKPKTKRQRQGRNKSAPKKWSAKEANFEIVA